jgi:hypothetical protein
MTKTITLAAAVSLLVLGGAAQAAPAGSDRAPDAVREAVAPAAANRPPEAQSQAVNPTGISADQLRPDGLMRNGLLPASGWQG